MINKTEWDGQMSIVFTCSQETAYGVLKLKEIFVSSLRPDRSFLIPDVTNLLPRWGIDEYSILGIEVNTLCINHDIQ